MPEEKEQTNFSENRKLLKEKAFSAIIELESDEIVRLLSKYAERYGWSEFNVL